MIRTLTRTVSRNSTTQRDVTVVARDPHFGMWQMRQVQEDTTHLQNATNRGRHIGRLVQTVRFELGARSVAALQRMLPPCAGNAEDS